MDLYAFFRVFALMPTTAHACTITNGNPKELKWKWGAKHSKYRINVLIFSKCKTGYLLF